MNRKKNIALAVALALVIAIAVGFVYDGIMTAVERASHPQKYADEVCAASELYHIPEQYIFAVIKVESNFDPDAKSGADAYGLMQLTAETFEDMTGDIALTEQMLLPEKNVMVGTKYLAYLYNMFGDMETAIAAYNAGLGNVRDWLADERYSDDGKTLKDIPFAETRNYVRRVREAVDIYERLYY